MKYRCRTAERFWTHFYRLDPAQKAAARKAWAIFKENPFDPRPRPHKIHRLSARYERPINAVEVGPDALDVAGVVADEGGRDPVEDGGFGGIVGVGFADAGDPGVGIDFEPCPVGPEGSIVTRFPPDGFDAGDLERRRGARRLGKCRGQGRAQHLRNERSAIGSHAIYGTAATEGKEGQAGLTDSASRPAPLIRTRSGPSTRSVGRKPKRPGPCHRCWWGGRGCW